MKDILYKIALWILVVNAILWFLYEFISSVSNSWGFVFIFTTIADGAGPAALYVLLALYLSKFQLIEAMDNKRRYSRYVINASAISLLFLAGIATFPLIPVAHLFDLSLLSLGAAIAGLYIILHNLLLKRETVVATPAKEENNTDSSLVEKDMEKINTGLLYVGILSNLFIVLPAAFMVIFARDGAAGMIIFLPAYLLSPFVLICNIIFLTIYLRYPQLSNKTRKIFYGVLIISIAFLLYHVLWWIGLK